MIKPRDSNEEVADLGEAVFERDVAAKLHGQDLRNFVAIDVHSGEFEVDADEGCAIRRLLDRKPGAQFWLRRAGSPIAHSFGPRTEYHAPLHLEGPERARSGDLGGRRAGSVIIYAYES